MHTNPRFFGSFVCFCRVGVHTNPRFFGSFVCFCRAGMHTNPRFFGSFVCFCRAGMHTNPRFFGLFVCFCRAGMHTNPSCLLTKVITYQFFNMQKLASPEYLHNFEKSLSLADTQSDRICTSQSKGSPGESE